MNEANLIAIIAIICGTLETIAVVYFSYRGNKKVIYLNKILDRKIEVTDKLYAELREVQNYVEVGMSISMASAFNEQPNEFWKERLGEFTKSWNSFRQDFNKYDIYLDNGIKSAEKRCSQIVDKKIKNIVSASDALYDRSQSRSDKLDVVSVTDKKIAYELDVAVDDLANQFRNGLDIPEVEKMK